MAKIIWLASYPKSGNTWMRVLLTNYLRNGSTPVDINRLDGGPIASARLWFDEWVGLGASSLDDAVIESLRPGVYRCMAAEAPDTVYMKVHDAWGRTDRGEALFPADVTAGVIYIVRNPLDMASSCAHHWGVDIHTAVTQLCDPEHAIARSLGGLSDQLRQRLLSWSGHVQSWLDESNLPVHVVRYEDLLATPHATFREVVRFCGLPLDDARVSRAVAFSDFSELQRQERETGFRERSLRAPGLFFRRGQAGTWREELPADLASRLSAAHGTMMGRFGYDTDNGGNDHGY
jgi:hypothetical protein